MTHYNNKLKKIKNNNKNIKVYFTFKRDGNILHLLKEIVFNFFFSLYF